MDRRTFVLTLAALFAACNTGPPGAITPDPASNFHKIYDDPALRERFLLFLKNIFHLYPSDDFHRLIADLTGRLASDREIYEQLLVLLPSIRPPASTLTFALPALEKQKDEMARQAATLLGEGTRIDGYLEIGSTGRYFRTLRERVDVQGTLFVVNDTRPGNTPADLIERGQLDEVGTFYDLGDYDPLTASIPDGSLDLVSNLIGFHHAPADRLEGFIGSIRRVLRPGGRLLLREHDVPDPSMFDFVALAHDVFNAGVLLSWADNTAQIRLFRSVPEWTALLESHGFTRAADTALQDGDPTDNTLLAFTRV